MFPGMSDNFQGRDTARNRILSDAEKEEQQIQDWLNGNGSMVIAGIVIFVVLFGFASMFL